MKKLVSVEIVNENSFSQYLRLIDEDEEVLVLAIAPEAAVEGFSLSLFGELALELSDEDEDGPLSEAVEGLLHGLLEGLEFSLDDVSWDELGRNLG